MGVLHSSSVLARGKFPDLKVVGSLLLVKHCQETWRKKGQRELDHIFVTSILIQFPLHFLKILLISWRNWIDRRGCYQPRNLETIQMLPSPWCTTALDEQPELKEIWLKGTPTTFQTQQTVKPSPTAELVGALPLAAPAQRLLAHPPSHKGREFGEQPMWQTSSEFAEPRLRRTLGVPCIFWKLSNLHSSLWLFQLETKWSLAGLKDQTGICSWSFS